MFRLFSHLFCLACLVGSSLAFAQEQEPAPDSAAEGATSALEKEEPPAEAAPPPVDTPTTRAAENISETLRASIEDAVARVKPSLVRIHVVETYYNEGREMKYEASGSGVVISAEGHVITNHHVAGHAKQLKVTFADKSEVEAEMVGTDPMTDIAIIKLKPAEPKEYTLIPFGDSSQVQVGDHVLAMGSPLALSQSVTSGIVSNTEMIMPGGVRQRGGAFEMDGEDVGTLVRWIGHDASIFPGNSGGPLVNLKGEIVGINEIGMGLGGAIPGNLAKFVAEQLITAGKVKRAWIGFDVQPRLKHSTAKRGVLVSSVLKDSPAEKAGIQSGDLLVSVGGAALDVRFQEQLPDFNRIMADLPIGESVELVVERKGQDIPLQVTPIEREAAELKEYEIKEWGVTVRNISFLLAKELKRPNRDGVLVTSVRPGGPAGDAKPGVNENDVLVEVSGQPVRNVEELQQRTAELLKDATEPKPVLAGFERKTTGFVTVVRVGIKELEDPGLEVKKAWLPVETQVITSDIAEQLGNTDLRGFRVTRVFEGSSAEEAGLKKGDLILAVDGEQLTASEPEHYEELNALIRQYQADTSIELSVRRDGQEMTVPVKVVRAPKLDREMKKYREENFEITVRDITFFDKATEKWKEEERGVLVDQVTPGSWAALWELSVGDLIQQIDLEPVSDVENFATRMKALEDAKPKSVVFKVLRGIHTFFVELEPKWETDAKEEGKAA